MVGINSQIERTFNNIPDGKIHAADQQSFLVSLGGSRAYNWQTILLSKRILIVSEAGAGKTFECRKVSKQLWDAGEPSFFVELADLANESLRNLLDEEEEARLDRWLSSETGIATFFLDSIDELNLTRGSFRQALIRFKKSIAGQLHRVRIIITTRPVPFDENLVKSILPFPEQIFVSSTEEAFADIAMRKNRLQSNNEKIDNPPIWRTVALMPLSNEQILAFCLDQGVSQPELLLEDLQRRNALEFARRPQDLIELSSDWRLNKRISTHFEQVSTNVRVKLNSRSDRPEPAELSVDKAIEGASRLALASQLTRRLTIRHSTEAEPIDEEIALDPSIILPDWLPSERKALLERPLFGFASYGRVRFHHRSVSEYLAAERLVTLRKQGMPFKALKRIIFADSNGKTIARPSKRSIAGWLALQEPGIFEHLRNHAPAVLLDEGDPGSLSQRQRNQALIAFTNMYGQGGWRGLRVPPIQIHRFASEQLENVVKEVWKLGVENPDVREILISIIGAGRIKGCADIVFDIARNKNASVVERGMAIDALVEIEDERLRSISESISMFEDIWSEKIIHVAVINLFPRYISVEQLCMILRRIKRENKNFGDFHWQLSCLIGESNFEIDVLERLRDGLVELLIEELSWQKGEWPKLSSEHPELGSILASICTHGLKYSYEDNWLRACSLALRVNDSDYSDDKPIKNLREKLVDLNASVNERFFWIEDAFLQSFCQGRDSWSRLTEIISYGGPLKLQADRDTTWVNEALKDTTLNFDERELLLEAAIHLARQQSPSAVSVNSFINLINDCQLLTKSLEDKLKPTKFDQQHQEWAERQAKQKEQRQQQEAKNRADWISFRKTIVDNPEKAFSKEHYYNTAWNLWKVAKEANESGQTVGWNRKFLEKHFCQSTVNKLRSVMMQIWRDEHPLLVTERAKNERNTIQYRWQFGLAGLYAESEMHDWASKLSDIEAELAARFALIELNSFPFWFDDLVCTHPDAVERVIGEVLTFELVEENGHSRLLQIINNASLRVARLFIPRLNTWMNKTENEGKSDDSNRTVEALHKIRLAAEIILKADKVTGGTKLARIAGQRLEQQLSPPFYLAWLSILMKVNPDAAVDNLEDRLVAVEPSERSSAVNLFASLFADRSNRVDLDNKLFTPHLLLRLVRLVYMHVRIQDDALHDGMFTPDTRDDAEMARSNIVKALFNSKGQAAFTAKLEMANDPLCLHFKDRILTIADENWAQEVDSEIFNDSQIMVLENNSEAPCTTNEAIFAVLVDRLSDLNELLLSDKTPREAWAGLSQERVMRREIARELGHAANSIYTVDQEAVTADEKETDIRLRSTTSKHEAVIELKLADGRSALDLLQTIENQLVKKYMASEFCRAGSLLITLSEDRKWQHPKENRKIDVEELMSLLVNEANRIQQVQSNNILINVHLLDLRPRLLTESEAT